MTRLIDMVAGGGWLFLLLIIARHFAVRRQARARDRSIDKAVAENRAPRGLPAMNRQQRRAAARHAARKGKTT